MADITIDSAVTALGLARANGRGIAWTSDQVGYLFFIDGDEDLKYTKTTDGGQTWNTPVTIYTGTTSRFAIWADWWETGNTGTKIRIAWVESGTDDVRYRDVDTAAGADTLGTARTIFAGASANTTVACYVSICTAGGYVYCYYDIDGGTEYGFSRSVNDGVNWSARTAPWVAQAGETEYHYIFPINTADAHDVGIISFNPSTGFGDDYGYGIYDDSANTWSVSAFRVGNVAYAENDTTATPKLTFAVRHSDKHILICLKPQVATNAGAFEIWDWNPNSNTIGSTSITQLTSVDTSADECDAPNIFIDQATNDIYVAYIGNADSAQTWNSNTGVYYRKSTDDATTWGSQVSIAVTVGAFRALVCDMMTYQDDTGRFMPVWSRTAATAALITNYDNSVSFGGGSPVTETMALATADAIMLAVSDGPGLGYIQDKFTANAISLTITAKIDVTQGLATATAEHLALLTGFGVLLDLSTATADHLIITAAINGAMEKSTANAVHLALVVNLLETLGLATATSDNLAITAAIKAAMEKSTATAEHLSLTLFADLIEQMAVGIATAEHLSITAKIDALMDLATATSEHLTLLAGLGLATEKATADAVMLAIISAINAALEIGTATAEHLALTVSSIALPATTTATAELLIITAAINALMETGTASAQKLPILLGLGTLLEIAQATAVHLPLTEENIAPDQVMQKMTADAIQLEMTAAINALMDVGTANAIHLALTMSAVLLMDKATASVEHLALVVNLLESMGLMTASADHLPLIAAFIAWMGLGTADAILLPLEANQDDVITLMALSTASAEMLNIIASLVSAMGVGTASAQGLALLGSIVALMANSTATAIELPLTDNVGTLLSLDVATANAAHLSITAAINAAMGKETADAQALVANAAIKSLLDIATASAVHLPIGSVSSSSFLGTMTASGIFIPSTAAIVALFDPMSATAQHLELILRTAEVAQEMSTMTASAQMLALVVDFLIGAILDGCVILDELIDKNAWISHVQASGFVEDIEEIEPSGYVKPIVQSIPSGYIKKPNSTAPWDL